MEEADFLVLLGSCADFSEQEESAVMSLLSAVQQDYIKKNRRAADRTRRLLARALLTASLHLMAKLPPEASLPRLLHSPQGQPQLAEGEWQISLTHSGDYAACAIGLTKNTGKVGLDVEEIRPLEHEDFAGVFTPEEMQAIASAPDPASERIRRWTLKESALKVHGTGFLENPHAINTNANPPFAALPDLTWQEMRLPQNAWLCAATEHPWKTLRFIGPVESAVLIKEIFDPYIPFPKPISCCPTV